MAVTEAVTETVTVDRGRGRVPGPLAVAETGAVTETVAVTVTGAESVTVAGAVWIVHVMMVSDLLGVSVKDFRI